MPWTNIWQTQLQDYVTAIAWAPDGQSLLAASAAGEVVLYRHQGQDHRLLRAADDQSIDTLGFCAEGDYIAAAGQSGQVLVWGLEPQPTLLYTLDYEQSWIDQLHWHPQEPVVSFSLGRYVQLWDAIAGEILITVNFEASSVLALAWHPAGHSLAVGGYQGIRIWSGNDWDQDPQDLGFMSACVGLAWSREGDYLAASNMDHTLFVWKWGESYPWQMQGFPGKVRQLHWLPWQPGETAPTLISSSQEGIITWQLTGDRKGWEPHVLDLHQGNVQALVAEPNQLILASAATDGWICLWQDVKEPIQILDGAKEYFSCLSWHPQGHYLAAGGNNGEIMVWEAPIS